MKRVLTGHGQHQCGGSRNKTGCNKKREPDRATTNVRANSLVVTKDNLEDQVGLSISMARFTSMGFMVHI